MCVTCFVHMIKRLNDTFIRACYWLTVTLYSAIKCFDWLKLRLVFIVVVCVDASGGFTDPLGTMNVSPVSPQ